MLKYVSILKTVALAIMVIAGFSCDNQAKKAEQEIAQTTYNDVPFIQETHEAFQISDNPDDNEIRGITVDNESTVWITTASGVFKKKEGTRIWEPVITGTERGPAYSVEIADEGTVFLGTWNGVYSVKKGELKKQTGPNPPVSVITSQGTETWALGPNGIWLLKNGNWEEQSYKIARSVRGATADGNGGLWVATDAGLYSCSGGQTKLFQAELISAYAKTVAFAPGNEIWTGVMGGVSVMKNGTFVKTLTPEQGIPSIFVNCIRQSPDSMMWVGTDVGIVRFAPDGSHSLRFSKRWLTNDKVNDIAFDKNGNAWIATENGVSLIKRNLMDLAKKQNHFYHELMAKHIREPWICGNLRLRVPGDTATWENTDDDNDGEYTGGYLAMESFRYATTKDPDALEKARKAFHFLRYLQEVTGTGNFFARTIVPADWTRVNDGNRTYTEQQIAGELVNDPRYKPVEKRWRLSADGKWLWKGDTSSDEMDGHMMSYFYFYNYAATEDDKADVRKHVSTIVDGLIKHNYNLVDIDGTHTRWGVWSPEKLNGDPDWASEKSLNSFELLAFLKFAYGITGNELYQKEYLKLIDEEGYLENARGINSKNPAWQIYFDLTMEGYMFPLLFKYETDPKLLAVYTEMLEKWMEHQPHGENLYNSLAYTICTGKKINVEQTIEFLKDTPLDLVDWPIDHTLREDVKVVHSPILEEVQISELPPASIRATVRWDKNPWAAIQGNPSQVREPVFWLWPYWEARYLGIIQE